MMWVVGIFDFQVTISYIDEDASLEERRAALADYAFLCRCSRCLEESWKLVQSQTTGKIVVNFYFDHGYAILSYIWGYRLHQLQNVCHYLQLSRRTVSTEIAQLPTLLTIVVFFRNTSYITKSSIVIIVEVFLICASSCPTNQKTKFVEGHFKTLCRDLQFMTSV